MGVANKAWRLSLLSEKPNLALSNQLNGKHYQDHQNIYNDWRWWRSSATQQQRRKVPWSLVCGLMLFGLGLVSLFTGHVASDLEWYSQRLVKRSIFYSRLEGRRREAIDIWKSKYSNLFYGCSERGRNFPPAVRERASNGYLLIAASGGLNQQRTGITDAVVVARILNATLVVPELDHHSYWKDNSDFVNIFDVDWFISYLAKDVTIVKRVPDKVMRSMEKPPYTMRVPRKSPPEYYLDQVLPILLRRRAVQLTKFDYRLASNLDEELQKLRCRANYHALRFTKPIQEIGERLVTKMRTMAKRYIAIHLRFEPDMLAFSGCYFGGGEKEKFELGEIRKRWATLPDLSPDGERERGKCPLTPHEVGLMLRALGFANDTYLYVASGEIYGGEETLRPLRELFPNFYTKEMLAMKELKSFFPFSSRMAAIDYIVCDESDVFVTNNNGNMAKILAGRRRYAGHKRTIRPNAKKLSALFKARDHMDWDTFSKKVKASQRGFMGEPNEVRPGRGDFHEYPSCICEKPFTDDKNRKGEALLSDRIHMNFKENVGENQGDKSLQRLKKRSMEELISLREEDGENFPD
ncbi:O-FUCOSYLTRANSFERASE 29 [Salix koriyanagi]|uniref:O-fucosyltransferase family protein n=1 Tax=Salix koriyanagi TaxID=2511006 RepID=A0A9Q0PXR7_9ROSI|nr:O-FUCOSYLTRANSFERASE 29 [Salix koriyanagi]